jgi:FG-GAP-like repeat
MAIDVSHVDPSFVTAFSDTVTTNTTYDANRPLDRNYVFADDIIAVVNAGVLVSGFGLRLETTKVGGGDIAMTNDGSINIDQATPALELRGNGGDFTYEGSGSITNATGTALNVINLGSGSVSITLSGQIHAGSMGAGVVAATNGAGGIAIDTTSGQVGTAAQRVGVFGIVATGNGATADDVSVTASDVFSTGEHAISAQINNAAATGDVIVTANGTVDSLLAAGITVDNTGSGRATVVVNGTVSGVDGIRASANTATVLNLGTITGTGGTAVRFFDGNDTYDGSGGTVVGTVMGGDGNDALISGAGNEAFEGGGGVDTVSYIAATGPVIVSLAFGFATGHGNDTLADIENARGSAFADTFLGTASPNVFSGGGGDDTFVVAPPNGADTVLGFIAGLANPDDRVDVRAFGLGSLDDVLALAVQMGADTRINFSGADSLTLRDVAMTDLVDDDFILVPQLEHVLWQHDNGRVRTTENDLGPAGNFDVVGVAEFDGDFDADILLRHPDGHNVIWEIQDGAFVTNHNLPDAPHTWDVVGAGDFDGDLDADVLWRNDTSIVTWEIQDNAFVQHNNLPSVPTNFTVAATGDFDNDGDDDILWRHEEVTTIWEMQDGAFVTNHNLPDVPTTWEVAAAGDFDGDGDADVIWRNDTSVTIWEIETNGFVTNHNQPDVAATWHVEATDDQDLDGDDDIIWRNDADGQIVSWTMQGNSLVQTTSFGAVADTWELAGTGVFDL